MTGAVANHEIDRHPVLPWIVGEVIADSLGEIEIAVLVEIRRSRRQHVGEFAAHIDLHRLVASRTTPSPTTMSGVPLRLKSATA